MKRSIYVVDDEELVLKMTVLIVRSMDHDWEVTGFLDPLSALEAVKARAPDAVLTDQMMPTMLGNQMLEQVRVVSPTTIRLLMSGSFDPCNVTPITLAHQTIAKPFEAAEMQDLIRRSFAAQKRVIDQGLQSMMTSIRSIPSLPQTHHALRAQLESAGNTSTSIACLIGANPGLSVKVLQLANSSLFKPDYQVTSLIEALHCLGIETITAIVLSQSVFRNYESLKHREIDLRRVKGHCWETACLAQHLCREKKLPKKTGEEAFLAGLLHEVGRFMLADNFPEQFGAACDEARQSKIPLAVCLRRVFQATSSQMSAYVLDLWGCPGPVIHSILFQDNPEKDQTPGFSMTSALYAADHLASRKSPPDSFALEEWNTSYLQAIGCAEDIPTWEKLSMNGPPGQT